MIEAKSGGRFGRRFRRAFRRDQRGGILVTASLSMLPLTMLAFAAVEFHNFTRQKVHLQDALDSAALAVARAPSAATQAQLRELYVSVLKSHLDLRPGLLTLVEAAGDPATGAGQQPSLTLANGRVTAQATVAISPIVANFFLKGDVKVNGRSEVVREVLGLEVALVLDNTGSMDTNNRIGIAKTAASSFVSILSEAASRSANPSAVKIGLVPFSSTVNVGSSYAPQTWMDRSAQSPIHDDIFFRRTSSYTTQGRSVAATYPAETWATTPNRWTMLSNIGASWSGCVESRPYPHDVRDTAPSTGNPATLFVPYFHPDAPDRVHQDDSPWYHASLPRVTVQEWALANNYVDDLRRAMRGYNTATGRLGAPWSAFSVSGYPTNQAAIDDLKRYVGGGDANNFLLGLNGTVDKYSTPTNVDFSSGKGPNNGCSLQPLTRLTANHATVQSAISAMTTGGGTNIPMGMVWGFHLLSPNAPFSDGSAYGTRNINKVAVLMTDGENDIPAFSYTGLGYAYTGRAGNASSDDAAIRTALNARLGELCSNMKAQGIVVYTVRVEVTGDNSLLQNCATDPGKAFDVKTAAELDPTFRQIAREIQNLRIAA